MSNLGFRPHTALIKNLDNKTEVEMDIEDGKIHNIRTRFFSITTNLIGIEKGLAINNQPSANKSPFYI